MMVEEEDFYDVEPWIQYKTSSALHWEIHALEWSADQQQW
jgi:hypothetical protein